LFYLFKQEAVGIQPFGGGGQLDYDDLDSAPQMESAPVFAAQAPAPPMLAAQRPVASRPSRPQVLGGLNEYNQFHGLHIELITLIL